MDFLFYFLAQPVLTDTSWQNTIFQIQPIFQFGWISSLGICARAGTV